MLISIKVQSGFHIVRYAMPVVNHAIRLPYKLRSYLHSLRCTHEGSPPFRFKGFNTVVPMGCRYLPLGATCCH